MNAQEAYRTLILGWTRPTRSWENRQLRDHLLHLPIDQVRRVSCLSREERDKFIAARIYKRKTDPELIEGYLAWPSVYDLLLYLECDCAILKKGDVAFRGQSDHRWALKPGLARDRNTVDYEIGRTVSWLSQLVSRYPALARYDPLKLVAIAQHYGCRTCLLDYTYDVRIAAAFACLAKSAPTSYGCIFYFYMAEVERYAPLRDLPTGSVIALELPEVPRIRRQEGLFLGAFNAQALADLTAGDRYLFRHSPEEQEFLVDVGLTAKNLMPNAVVSDEIGQQADAQSSQVTWDPEPVVDILVSWTTKCLSSLDWEEYLRLATAYIEEDQPLNHQQLKRLRIFCRWFAALHGIAVPEHALAINRLYQAAFEIRDYYRIGCECQDFFKQFAAQTPADVLSQVLSALRDARLLEHYNESEDGPDEWARARLWLRDEA